LSNFPIFFPFIVLYGFPNRAFSFIIIERQPGNEELILQINVSTQVPLSSPERKYKFLHFSLVST